MDREEYLRNHPSLAATLDDSVVGITQRRDYLDMANNMDEASAINPDSHANALKVEKQTGIPADLVRDDPEFQPEPEYLKAEYLKKHPALAKSLTDPDFAKLASDDLSVLEEVGNVFSSIKEGYQSGIDINEIGRFSSKFEGITDKEAKRVNELKKAQENRPEYEGVAFMTGSAAEIVGQMTDSFGEVLKDSLTSGGALGFLFNDVSAKYDKFRQGQPLLPGSIDEAVAQVKSGSKQHVVLNYLSDIFSIEAGHFYSDMIDTVVDPNDPASQKIDPELVKAGAVAVGTINAALEAVGLGFIGKPIASGVRKLVSEPIKQTLRKATVGSATKGFLKNYATSVAGETVTEVLQENVNMGIGEIVKAFSEGDFESITFDQWMQANEQIFTKVAAGMALVGLPGASFNYAMDLKQVQQAKDNREYMESLGHAVKASKLRERSPEYFQRFIDNTLVDGPVENVYIPIDAFDEYFQSQGISPDDVASEVPSIAAKIDQARLTGEDLSIPLAEYSSKIAGTEFHQGLIDHVRLRPDQLTYAEAISREENPESDIQTYLDQAAEQSAPIEKAQQAFNQIFEQVQQGLVDVGEAPTIAARQGVLIPSFYANLEKRYGVDAAETFNNRNVSIRAPGSRLDIRQSPQVREYLQSQGIDPDTATEQDIQALSQPSEDYVQAQNDANLFEIAEYC